MFLGYVLSMPPVSVTEVPFKAYPRNSSRPGVADHRSLQALFFEEEGYKVPIVEGVPPPQRVVAERVGCLGHSRFTPVPVSRAIKPTVCTRKLVSWCERSVEHRLTNLGRKDWNRGQPAFEWLRETEDW